MRFINNFNLLNAALKLIILYYYSSTLIINALICISMWLILPLSLIKNWFSAFIRSKRFKWYNKIHQERFTSVNYVEISFLPMELARDCSNMLSSIYSVSDCSLLQDLRHGTKLSRRSGWLPSPHIENCIHLTAPRQREPVKIWAIRRSLRRAKRWKGRESSKERPAGKGIRNAVGYQPVPNRRVLVNSCDIVTP